MGRSTVLAKLFVAALCIEQARSTFVPSIKTSAGTVKGTVVGRSPDVLAYLSIPYAVPPVNELRWTAPKRLEQPDAIIDGSLMPVSCSQYLSDAPNIYYTYAPEFIIPGPVSEDCLTVSIWKPVKQSNVSLPVLIWIYGGGFSAGGAAVPYQLPDQWIQRTQSHIVVSINYRVHVMGFPNAIGLETTEQNLGLRDQRLAVEWIRDNIAAFGGDPTRMGLWGQSAGAVSVDWYNHAYKEDPIVNSLMQDSGSALIPLINTQAAGTSFSKLAGYMGCGNLSATAELNCMREIPATNITAFLLYAVTNTSLSFTFYPIVDNVTVFDDYTDRTLSGNFSKVPALINTNEVEGVASVTFSYNGPNETAAYHHTSNYFLCPAYHTAINRHRGGATTFRSYYGGNWSNISPIDWMGAYHDSDLPMKFGTHSDCRGNSTPEEYSLANKMQDAYVAFVRSPEQGLKELGWEAYSPANHGPIRGWGTLGHGDGNAHVLYDDMVDMARCANFSTSST